MTTWGMKTINASAALNSGYMNFIGGVSPAGANQLDSIQITADSAASVRLGLYSGGSASDLTGATLLEDLGSASIGAGGVITINSSTNPAVPDGGRLWLCLNSESGILDRNSSIPIDDIDAVLRVFYNQADSVALPVSPTGGSAITSAFSVVMNYSAIGPAITDIDTNDDVFPGQSADITGVLFGASQGGGDVSLGGVAQTVTAWADTEITITVVQSGLKYGDHDLIVTDDSAVSSAALTTTLSPSPTNQFVNVVNPRSDSASLFFGASPAVVTGDQLEAPLLTTQGKTLTINADGTFVITDASGLQTFSIRVWDATDETWSTSAIATINGEVTPPSSIGGSMARAMVNG